MYGFGKPVDGSYEEVVEKVTDELQKEGFGLISDIDVAAALKSKLDIDRRPYRILGACNPALANQAIQAEDDIGLLLPCNVLVREDDDGQVHVSFMDPATVLGLVGNEDLAGLGAEVRGRLERVRDAL